MKLLNYLLLINTCIVVNGAYTFTDVATKLEEVFNDGSGDCQEGAIRTILGGSDAVECPAFTSLVSSLDADPDMLATARSVMLGMVEIETRFNHLEKIREEFIDETHDRYVFSDSTEHDLYGCSRQLILSVVANGANSGLFNFVPPGAVIGKRSDSTCIESRVVEVLEAIGKYKTAGSEEKEMVTPDNDSTAALVIVSSTLPPAPITTTAETPNNNNESTEDSSIIAIAIACLALAIAVPALVFYYLQASKKKERERNLDALPPTMLAEWFVEKSSHGEEQADLI